MHETPEAISALIDGELAAADAARAKAHLAACAECAGMEAKLKAGSAAFRRSGAVQMPADLAARAKRAAAPGVRPGLKLAYAMVAIMLAVFVSGVALKKLMPTLFNNIQQMITGAAGQMGSGGE